VPEADRTGGNVMFGKFWQLPIWIWDAMHTVGMLPFDLAAAESPELAGRTIVVLERLGVLRRASPSSG
jgi:hypothetical protein